MKLRFFTKTIAVILILTFTLTSSIAYPDIPSFVFKPAARESTADTIAASNSMLVRSELRKQLGLPSENSNTGLLRKPGIVRYIESLIQSSQLRDASSESQVPSLKSSASQHERKPQTLNFKLETKNKSELRSGFNPPFPTPREAGLVNRKPVTVQKSDRIDLGDSVVMMIKNIVAPEETLRRGRQAVGLRVARLHFNLANPKDVPMDLSRLRNPSWLFNGEAPAAIVVNGILIRFGLERMPGDNEVLQLLIEAPPAREIKKNDVLLEISRITHRMTLIKRQPFTVRVGDLISLNSAQIKVTDFRMPLAGIRLEVVPTNGGSAISLGQFGTDPWLSLRVPVEIRIGEEPAKLELKNVFRNGTAQVQIEAPENMKVTKNGQFQPLSGPPAKSPQAGRRVPTDEYGPIIGHYPPRGRSELRQVEPLELSDPEEPLAPNHLIEVLNRGAGGLLLFFGVTVPLVITYYSIEWILSVFQFSSRHSRTNYPNRYPAIKKSTLPLLVSLAIGVGTGCIAYFSEVSNNARQAVELGLIFGAVVTGASFDVIVNGLLPWIKFRRALKRIRTTNSWWIKFGDRTDHRSELRSGSSLIQRIANWNVKRTLRHWKRGAKRHPWLAVLLAATFVTACFVVPAVLSLDTDPNVRAAQAIKKATGVDLRGKFPIQFTDKSGEGFFDNPYIQEQIDHALSFYNKRYRTGEIEMVEIVIEPSPAGTLTFPYIAKLMGITSDEPSPHVLRIQLLHGSSDASNNLVPLFANTIALQRLILAEGYDNDFRSAGSASDYFFTTFKIGLLVVLLGGVASSAVIVYIKNQLADHDWQRNRRTEEDIASAADHHRRRSELRQTEKFYLRNDSRGEIVRKVLTRFLEDNNPFFVIGDLERKWSESQLNDRNIFPDLGKVAFHRVQSFKLPLNIFQALSEGLKFFSEILEHYRELAFARKLRFFLRFWHFRFPFFVGGSVTVPSIIEYVKRRLPPGFSVLYPTNPIPAAALVPSRSELRRRPIDAAGSATPSITAKSELRHTIEVAVGGQRTTIPLTKEITLKEILMAALEVKSDQDLEEWVNQHRILRVEMDASFSAVPGTGLTIEVGEMFFPSGIEDIFIFEYLTLYNFLSMLHSKAFPPASAARILISWESFLTNLTGPLQIEFVVEPKTPTAAEPKETIAADHPAVTDPMKESIEVTLGNHQRRVGLETRLRDALELLGKTKSQLEGEYPTGFRIKFRLLFGIFFEKDGSWEGKTPMSVSDGVWMNSVRNQDWFDLPIGTILVYLYEDQFGKFPDSSSPENLRKALKRSQGPITIEILPIPASESRIKPPAEPGASAAARSASRESIPRSGLSTASAIEELEMIREASEPQPIEVTILRLTMNKRDLVVRYHSSTGDSVDGFIWGRSLRKESTQAVFNRLGAGGKLQVYVDGFTKSTREHPGVKPFFWLAGVTGKGGSPLQPDIPPTGIPPHHRMVRQTTRDGRRESIFEVSSDPKEPGKQRRGGTEWRRSELRIPSSLVVERLKTGKFVVTVEYDHLGKVHDAELMDKKWIDGVVLPDAALSEKLLPVKNHALILAKGWFVGAYHWFLFLQSIYRFLAAIFMNFAHAPDSYPLDLLFKMPDSVVTIAASFRTKATIKNRILRADDSGAQALLVVSGGGLSQRWFGWLMPMNSEKILALIGDMKAGGELSPDFPVFAVVNPYGNSHIEIAKSKKKGEAGVQALFTQPDLDIDAFRDFWNGPLTSSAVRGIPKVVGMPIIPDAAALRMWFDLTGINPRKNENAARLLKWFETADSDAIKKRHVDLIKEIQSLPTVAGIHIMSLWSMPLDFVKDILREAGLSPEDRAHLGTGSIAGQVLPLQEFKPVPAGTGTEGTKPIEVQTDVRQAPDKFVKVVKEVQARDEKSPLAASIWSQLPPREKKGRNRFNHFNEIKELIASTVREKLKGLVDRVLKNGESQRLGIHQGVVHFDLSVEQKGTTALLITLSDKSQTALVRLEASLDPSMIKAAARREEAKLPPNRLGSGRSPLSRLGSSVEQRAGLPQIELDWKEQDWRVPESERNRQEAGVSLEDLKEAVKAALRDFTFEKFPEEIDVTTKGGVRLKVGLYVIPTRPAHHIVVYEPTTRRNLFSGAFKVVNVRPLDKSRADQFERNVFPHLSALLHTKRGEVTFSNDGKTPPTLLFKSPFSHRAIMSQLFPLRELPVQQYQLVVPTDPEKFAFALVTDPGDPYAFDDFQEVYRGVFSDKNMTGDRRLRVQIFPPWTDITRRAELRAHEAHRQLRNIQLALYQEENREMGEQLHKIFSQTFGQVSGSKSHSPRKLLHLGARDGAITERIADLFDEVLIFETDRERLRHLHSERFRGLTIIDNEQWLVQWLDQISGVEGEEVRFDGIVLSHKMFQDLLKRDPKILSKARALLKPEGRLAVYMNSNQPEDGNQVKIQRDFKEARGQETSAHGVSWIQKSLRRKRYSFKVIKVPTPFVVGSEEELIPVILAILPNEFRDEKNIEENIRNYIAEHRSDFMLGSGEYRLWLDQQILWVSPKGSSLREKGSFEFPVSGFGLNEQETRNEKLETKNRSELRSPSLEHSYVSSFGETGDRASAKSSFAKATEDPSKLREAGPGEAESRRSRAELRAKQGATYSLSEIKVLNPTELRGLMDIVGVSGEENLFRMFIEAAVQANQFEIPTKGKRELMLWFSSAGNQLRVVGKENEATLRFTLMSRQNNPNVIDIYLDCPDYRNGSGKTKWKHVLEASTTKAALELISGVQALSQTAAQTAPVSKARKPLTPAEFAAKISRLGWPLTSFSNVSSYKKFFGSGQKIKFSYQISPKHSSFQITLLVEDQMGSTKYVVVYGSSVQGVPGVEVRDGYARYSRDGDHWIDFDVEEDSRGTRILIYFTQGFYDQMGQAGLRRSFSDGDLDFRLIPLTPDKIAKRAELRRPNVIANPEGVKQSRIARQESGEIRPDGFRRVLWRTSSQLLTSPRNDGSTKSELSLIQSIRDARDGGWLSRRSELRSFNYTLLYGAAAGILIGTLLLYQKTRSILKSIDPDLKEGFSNWQLAWAAVYIAMRLRQSERAIPFFESILSQIRYECRILNLYLEQIPLRDVVKQMLAAFQKNSEGSFRISITRDPKKPGAVRINVVPVSSGLPSPNPDDKTFSADSRDLQDDRLARRAELREKGSFEFPVSGFGLNEQETRNEKLETKNRSELRSDSKKAEDLKVLSDLMNQLETANEIVTVLLLIAQIKKVTVLQTYFFKILMRATPDELNEAAEALEMTRLRLGGFQNFSSYAIRSIQTRVPDLFSKLSVIVRSGLSKARRDTMARARLKQLAPKLSLSRVMNNWVQRIELWERTAHPNPNRSLHLFRRGQIASFLRRFVQGVRKAGPESLWFPSSGEVRVYSYGKTFEVAPTVDSIVRDSTAQLILETPIERLNVPFLPTRISKLVNVPLYQVETYLHDFGDGENTLVIVIGLSSQDHIEEHARSHPRAELRQNSRASETRTFSQDSSPKTQERGVTQPTLASRRETRSFRAGNSVVKTARTASSSVPTRTSREDNLSSTASILSLMGKRDSTFPPTRRNSDLSDSTKVPTSRAVNESFMPERVLQRTPIVNINYRHTLYDERGTMSSRAQNGRRPGRRSELRGESPLSAEQVLMFLQSNDRKQLEAVSAEINKAFHERITEGESELFNQYLTLVRSGRIKIEDVIKLSNYDLAEFNAEFLFHESVTVFFDSVFAEENPAPKLDQLFHSLPEGWINRFSFAFHLFLYVKHPFKGAWPVEYPARKIVEGLYREFLKVYFPDYMEEFESVLPNRADREALQMTEQEFERRLADHQGLESWLAEEGSDEAEKEEARALWRTWDRVYTPSPARKGKLADFRVLIDAGKFGEVVAKYGHDRQVLSDFIQLISFPDFGYGSPIPGYGYERAWRQLRELKDHGLPNEIEMPPLEGSEGVPPKCEGCEIREALEADREQQPPWNPYREGVATILEFAYPYFMTDADLIRWAHQGLDERIGVIRVLQVIMDLDEQEEVNIYRLDDRATWLRILDRLSQLSSDTGEHQALVEVLRRLEGPAARSELRSVHVGGKHDRIFDLPDFPMNKIKGMFFFVRTNLDDTHFDLSTEEIDDIRIHKTARTVDFISKHGGITILFNHIGRPGGKYNSSLRTDSIAEALGRVLHRPIRKTDGNLLSDGTFRLIGKEERQVASQMRPGDILMLENTRMDSREQSKDPEERMKLAQEIASLAPEGKGVFVIDGFPITHRDSTASMAEMASLLPGLKGFWELEEEALHKEFLALLADNQRRGRLTAIFGGNKADKRNEITQFSDVHLRSGDHLILAGKYGSHLLEPQVLEKLRQRGIYVSLPLDSNQNNDVGPATIAQIKKILGETDTLFWEGPLGQFEQVPFHQGTFEIARTVAELTQKQQIKRSFISGGELGFAVKQALGWNEATRNNIAGLTISTGGGTSIAFLSLLGNLPGTRFLSGWNFGDSIARSELRQGSSDKRSAISGKVQSGLLTAYPLTLNAHLRKSELRAGLPPAEILEIVSGGDETRLETVSREIKRAIEVRLRYGNEELLNTYRVLIAQKRLTTAHIEKLLDNGLDEEIGLSFLHDIWKVWMDDLLANEEPDSSLEEFFESLPERFISDFSSFIVDWPFDSPAKNEVLGQYRKVLAEKFPRHVKNFDQKRFQAAADAHFSQFVEGQAGEIQQAIPPNTQLIEDVITFRGLIEAKDYRTAVKRFGDNPGVFVNYFVAMSKPGYGYEKAINELGGLRSAGLSDGYYLDGLAGIFANSLSFMDEGYVTELAAEGGKAVRLAILHALQYKLALDNKKSVRQLAESNDVRLQVLDEVETASRQHGNAYAAIIQVLETNRNETAPPLSSKDRAALEKMGPAGIMNVLGTIMDVGDVLIPDDKIQKIRNSSFVQALEKLDLNQPDDIAALRVVAILGGSLCVLRKIKAASVLIFITIPPLELSQENPVAKILGKTSVSPYDFFDELERLTKDRDIYNALLDAFSYQLPKPGSRNLKFRNAEFVKLVKQNAMRELLFRKETGTLILKPHYKKEIMGDLDQAVNNLSSPKAGERREAVEQITATAMMGFSSLAKSKVEEYVAANPPANEEIKQTIEDLLRDIREMEKLTGRSRSELRQDSRGSWVVSGEKTQDAPLKTQDKSRRSELRKSNVIANPEGVKQSRIARQASGEIRPDGFRRVLWRTSSQLLTGPRNAESFNNQQSTIYNQTRAELRLRPIDAARPSPQRAVAESGLRIMPMVSGVDLKAFAEASSRIEKSFSSSEARSELRAALVGQPTLQNRPEGIAVERKLAFDEGTLPYFAALARSELRVVIVAPTTIEQQLVAALNEGRAPERQLLVAKDPTKAARLLHASGVVRKIYVASTAVATSLIKQVFDQVVILSRKAIVELRLSVQGVVDDLHQLRLIHDRNAMYA